MTPGPGEERNLYCGVSAIVKLAMNDGAVS